MVYQKTMTELILSINNRQIGVELVTAISYDQNLKTQPPTNSYKIITMGIKYPVMSSYMAVKHLLLNIVHLMLWIYIILLSFLKISSCSLHFNPLHHWGKFSSSQGIEFHLWSTKELRNEINYANWEAFD